MCIAFILCQDVKDGCYCVGTIKSQYAGTPLKIRVIEVPFIAKKYLSHKQATVEPLNVDTFGTMQPE